MRRALPIATLVFATVVAACGDSGLDSIAVTVEGTVTGQGEVPVPALWIHLLAGPQGAPRPVSAAETDVFGEYIISTAVVPADCNDLHLRVLETQQFDADVEPLDASLLGSCGNLVADFVVDVEPPVPEPAEARRPRER